MFIQQLLRYLGKIEVGPWLWAIAGSLNLVGMLIIGDRVVAFRFVDATWLEVGPVPCTEETD
jgi:hypothetical protein